MNSNSNAEAVLRHSSPQGNTVAINLNSNSTAEAENWSTDNSQQTTGFGFESNLCLWSQTCRLG